MSTHHFINDPTHLVNTALRSLTLTNPSVLLDAENKIVYRTSNPSHTAQVSIVSGGGSGHEPSFAGFVGDGLLAASVAGTIFASPGAEQVRRAVMDRVPREKGVCVVVMNYTGDVLNFGMAVEKARAGGRDVEMVVAGDDVGVGRAQGGKVGRRGIAGTCLVLKIAGALAASGASLKDVTRVARLTADNVVSVGASLSHVHVPGRAAVDTSEDAMKEGEIEVGMGIHNEPGSERVRTDLVGLVKKMLAQLLDQSDKDRSFLEISKTDKTVLLVNNLGGVSVLELGGIVCEVSKQLDESYAIKPVRVLAATFMTSLNGMGFSISILRLEDTKLEGGKTMLDLLDAPAEAVEWTSTIKSSTWDIKSESVSHVKAEEGENMTSNIKMDYSHSKRALTSGLNKVIAAESEITYYDTVVGDGDCGTGLKRGAEALLQMLDSSAPTDDVLSFLQNIIHVVETTMDGTSGALYAIFLNALAKGIRDQSSTPSEQVQVGIWAKALESALTALSKYTPAKPGDRTLVDALYPFVGTLAHTGNVQRAAKAAEDGAKKTQGMKASLGRTVYVGGEGYEVVPDPGAWGLSEFLLGLAEGLQ